MKSLFLLIDEAKQKYYSSNAEFQNKVDVMLSMLRSVGAVPYRRKKLNGHVHKLISATLVHAYESSETIRMTTRMLATFHYMGISTKFMKYLDKAVQENLLISDLSKDKAEGNLTFTDTTTKWLNTAH